MSCGCFSSFLCMLSQQVVVLLRITKKHTGLYGPALCYFCLPSFFTFKVQYSQCCQVVYHVYARYLVGLRLSLMGLSLW